MKIKFADIENMYAALVNAGNIRLPRAASVAIARNIMTLRPELEVYTGQKDEILKRYAALDADGNPITQELADGRVQYAIDKEKRCIFTEEIEELNNIEIDVAVRRFPASILDMCDASDRYDVLTAAQEADIAWMIDYEEAK